ncbi:TetR/AcrR family transcriptional regulator [Oscillospiraceae bacterium CM]|nr:TetR/AcrR family transcriptional regulator [Oscillospiraceae bacterium CM]
MNGKFYELPEEKRLRIINAGFEVFGQSDYRHASTEQIASKADISKGLLFYYFHDKKSLYLFLFEYAANRIKEHVVDARLSEITDFFELSAYAAERKCQMLRESPFILAFIMRAFYSEREAVSDAIRSKIQAETAAIYGTYFSKIDYSKFREDISPQDIFQMLTWLIDGYLHEKQDAGLPVELGDVMDKYRLWSSLLKKVSYKEEFLNERSH